MLCLFQAEQTNLAELMKEADSLKYSCHASSILDTDSLSDHMADISVSNNKVRTALHKSRLQIMKTVSINSLYNFHVAVLED